MYKQAALAEAAEASKAAQKDTKLADLRSKVHSAAYSEPPTGTATAARVRLQLPNGTKLDRYVCTCVVLHHHCSRLHMSCVYCIVFHTCTCICMYMQFMHTYMHVGTITTAATDLVFTHHSAQQLRVHLQHTMIACNRRFDKSLPVRAIADYLELQLIESDSSIQRFSLSTNYPKRTFSSSEELATTIDAAGLHPQAVLFVHDLDA
jgi:UBX domain